MIILGDTAGGFYHDLYINQFRHDATFGEDSTVSQSIYDEREPQKPETPPVGATGDN